MHRDWQLPLLRFEAGRLFDKYIGESERRLERALAAAERMAPCVMLMDEIEKALALDGGQTDGGLSRRIFGRLLGWLQDRRAPVFVVATCNGVHQLPPEIMRKGRFDEIFFVDLPGRAERYQIFEVHLAARQRDPSEFDLSRLAGATDGFSGAEVEQAVVAAMYSAFADGRALATTHVLREIESTRPLSVTRAEEIGALRAWAAGRAVPATSAAAA